MQRQALSAWNQPGHPGWSFAPTAGIESPQLEVEVHALVTNASQWTKCAEA